MTSQPLHTFGEGKSYTTFACSDVSVNKEENGAAVSFTVENTGAMAGTSVPCLYVRKRSGGVVARIKELKAFTRISLASRGWNTSTSIAVTQKTFRAVPR